MLDMEKKKSSSNCKSFNYAAESMCYSFKTVNYFAMHAFDIFVREILYNNWTGQALAIAIYKGL